METIKYMKDKNGINTNYIYSLREHILKNQQVFFQKGNEADAWCDFIQWPDKQTDRHHLCMPNEPFLVDRDYKGKHCYCICTISENRKITSQEPVIEIDELDRHFWRNGYFLLPVLDK